MFELLPARATQSSRTRKIFGYVENHETGVSYVNLVEIYAKLRHLFPSNGVLKHFSYLLVQSLCTAIYSLVVEPPDGDIRKKNRFAETLKAKGSSPSFHVLLRERPREQGSKPLVTYLVAAAIT